MELAQNPRQAGALCIAALALLRRVELRMAKVPGEFPKLTAPALAALFVWLRSSGRAFTGRLAAQVGKLLLLAALGSYCYDLAAHLWARCFQKLPPGPLPIPLLGSLQLIPMSGYWDSDGNPLVHRAMTEIGKKYGPIWGLWMGSYYTVIISDPAIGKQAFVTKGRTTSDRCTMQSHGGHHVPSMYIATRDGQGIAMSTGRYWRKVRTALETNISRQAPAERNAPIVLREVESFVCAVRDACRSGDGTVQNLTNFLKRESMNIATTLLFSMRFGADLPEDFKVLKHSVEYIFKNLSNGNPSDMIPIFRVFPSPFLREFDGVVKRRDEVLGRIIAQHRREFDALKREGKMNERRDCRDLVDQFFMDQDAGELTADELHVVVWDILFAMTDTTASTNEWLTYYLVNYPEVQRKVHAELDRVVGHDRLPTLEDREKLPYFWSVIKEVMRIRIISPLLAPHYCSEETELDDGRGKTYKLPRGTAIFLNAWGMAQDKDLWGPDAEEFRPERWLEDKRNEGLDLHGKEERRSTEHYKYIPFSLGQRNCPGYSFAKVVTFMQAATISQCFEWSLSPGAQSSPKVKNGKLDLTETWGLAISPQRHGDSGLIAAKPRPAAALCRPLSGDSGAAATADRVLQGQSVGQCSQPANKVVTVNKTGRKISMDEVRRHNQPGDCWLVHQRFVYDVSSFMNEHPGGAAQIMDHGAGRDATQAFNDVGHSAEAMQKLASLCIGELP